MFFWFLCIDIIVFFFFWIKYLFFWIYIYFGVMNCIKFILYCFLLVLRKIGVEVFFGLKIMGWMLVVFSFLGIFLVLFWLMKCLFFIDLLFISEILIFSCLVFKILLRLLWVLFVLKGWVVFIVLFIKFIKFFFFDNLIKISNIFWWIKSWFENLKLNFFC